MVEWQTVFSVFTPAPNIHSKNKRAPNYGKTLFPYFIASAEQYVSKVAKVLIAENEEQQQLYYDTVIYLVLAKLCGISVTLHEQAKKAPFFCKNSVERKGKLKTLLQSYAPDHQYIQGFPSCFEEAVGYFEVCFILYVSTIKCTVVVHIVYILEKQKKSNGYLDDYRHKYLEMNEVVMPKKIKKAPKVSKSSIVKKEPQPLLSMKSDGLCMHST